jgi:DNA-binding MarR family transcriptional regulator
VASRDSSEFYERFAEVLRCIRAISEDAYAELELGTAQAKFVRYIGAHGGISQAALARATRTAPTLTGRVLGALVERGWVRRKRSDEDRREYVLELTAAGQRIRAQVDKARAGVVAQLAKVLDDQDARDFERIAGKILGAFAKPD